MTTRFNDLIARDRVFAWIELVTGLLLLIPLSAMQFTKEMNWDETDFIVMGFLIFVTSSLFVLVARKLSRKYWPVISVVFATAFLFLWAELAVGIFTNWGS
jgi:hypothetical protein